MPSYPRVVRGKGVRAFPLQFASMLFWNKADTAVVFCVIGGWFEKIRIAIAPKQQAFPWHYTPVDTPVDQQHDLRHCAWKSFVFQTTPTVLQLGTGAYFVAGAYVL